MCINKEQFSNKRRLCVYWPLPDLPMNRRSLNLATWFFTWATELRSSELQFSSFPARMVTRVPSSTSPKMTTRKAVGNVLLERQCFGRGEHRTQGLPVATSSPGSMLDSPIPARSYDESMDESGDRPTDEFWDEEHRARLGDLSGEREHLALGSWWWMLWSEGRRCSSISLGSRIASEMKEKYWEGWQKNPNKKKSKRIDQLTASRATRAREVLKMTETSVHRNTCLLKARLVLTKPSHSIWPLGLHVKLTNHFGQTVANDSEPKSQERGPASCLTSKPPLPILKSYLVLWRILNALVSPVADSSTRRAERLVGNQSALSAVYASQPSVLWQSARSLALFWDPMFHFNGSLFACKNRLAQKKRKKRKGNKTAVLPLRILMVSFFEFWKTIRS